MSLLVLIVLFTLLGGVLSVMAAAVFLLLPERLQNRVLPHFISFATGALLGAAFLALLPHALEAQPGIDAHQITLTVLLGVLLFFLLEKMVLWRHCHSTTCDVHGSDEHEHSHRHDRGHPAARASGIFILIGDGLHNFIDGVLIGAAFLTDPHLGVVTALAVAAHEIPQELGDFAVLLHGGFSRKRALWYNIAVSRTTILGGLLAYVSLSGVQHYLPFVLALAASSFIYIAVADLIPGLHRKTHLSASVQQVGLITLGVGAIYLAHSTLH